MIHHLKFSYIIQTNVGLGLFPPVVKMLQGFPVLCSAGAASLL